MASMFERRWHAGEISWRTRYLWRLLCCAPSFVCAFLMPSLANALGFTGIIGIVLPFIVTPLLHLSTLTECRKRWGEARFDRFEDRHGFGLGALSAPLAVGVAGAAGTALLIYCVTSLG